MAREKSAPKQLINEVPSHVVLVDNKVGAEIGILGFLQLVLTKIGIFKCEFG